MPIDYKFNGITSSNGIATANVTFYEGAITTEMEERGLKRTLIPITRYRRTKALGTTTIRFKEPITQTEIVKLVNDRLVKLDITKSPILEQKATSISYSLRAKILL